LPALPVSAQTLPGCLPACMPGACPENQDPAAHTPHPPSRFPAVLPPSPLHAPCISLPAHPASLPIPSDSAPIGSPAGSVPRNSATALHTPGLLLPVSCAP